MKIAVIGSGAMGSLFGALLAESGQDVWLLDVWAAHMDAVAENGLSVESEETTRVVKINATTEPDRIGLADPIIIFVKSMHTKEAATTAMKMAGDNSRLLTLQNGMGNADIIADVVSPIPVMAGTTSQGATMLGPGKIKHAGFGPTTIGIWSGDDATGVQEISEMFDNAGIETHMAEDIRSVVWDKLFINVGINAITALTGIKNGQLMDLKATQALSRTAVSEAMAVARAQGIKVREDTPEHVLEIAKNTALNRSSMGQDVDNKRRTEIDAINGVVVREGKRLGVETPVNQTLTTLIETLQKHY